MAYRDQIAAEIRAEMAAQRCTVTQLAATTHYSRSKLQGHLSGRRAFDTDELEAVTRALGISVRDLLTRAEARAAA